jgi:spermidine synthase
VLAQLYFANSIGGAAGVLIAGFWLLNVGGLPFTLDVAAIVNLVVFLIALGVARSGSHRAGVLEAAPEPIEE